MVPASRALDVTLPARFLWQAYPDAGAGRRRRRSGARRPSTRRAWCGGCCCASGPDGWSPPSRAPGTLPGGRRAAPPAPERLADLFDQYQVYRADWLDAWRRARTW
ncbi:hypothetical protein DSL92_06725 [Billgrantia gudaonensis]|uniref:Uncharacterized protein n=1 Tax=Billgrantia gudaonensis TaxID=376427 RepID=A0A3S0NDU8_9GAMM|nr:hypothetical protein DSL92_06725 [Halomonas gudaonensis]